MLKPAVINVKSTDIACFAWSVVAALYSAERKSERKSLYPHYTMILNFDDIEFPMTLKNIRKFERLNNMSINFYDIDRKVFRCDLRITRRRSMSIYYTCKIRETT